MLSYLVHVSVILKPHFFTRFFLPLIILMMVYLFPDSIEQIYSVNMAEIKLFDIIPIYILCNFGSIVVVSYYVFGIKMILFPLRYILTRDTNFCRKLLSY